MNFEKRKKKLVGNLDRKQSKPDCIVITSLPNLKYYFNYGGASYERFCGGVISLESGKSALVVPKLDEGKTASSSVDGVFAWTDSEGYQKSLEDALKSIGGKSRIFGCEDWITLYLMEAIKKVRAAAKFESVSPTIADQRLIKEEEEIEALRSSSAKLGKGHEKIPQILKAGQSEIEAGYGIKKSLADLGAADVDFCAVQSGPNSAVPHSQTTQRKLSPGDMIVIDISCVDDSGYFADFTRTFSVGSPNEEQRKVYEVVKDAQSTGTTVAKPGIPARDIDRVVRGIIEKAGYGKYFVHRTGHGLGIEVHEAPWINGANASKLRSGMVFTIEPGIYLPGKFGVRIEDNIVLNATGNENLTHVAHELVQI
jgi:Xaa-Pro dipeptidase